MESNKTKRKNKKKEKRNNLNQQAENQISDGCVEKQPQDKPISKIPFLKNKQIKVLINQQEKSLCKVNTKKSTNNGFLCCIPDPVLITTNKEENIKLGATITIYFNDGKISKKIKIDKNRKIRNIKKVVDTKFKISIVVIEIKNEDELEEQEFLEVDNKLLNNDFEYKSKNIYLIYYKPVEESWVSFGIINTVNKFLCEIEHNADVDNSSNGCPILLENNKVIAVQGETNSIDKINQGILLNLLIEQYYLKFTNKNKNKISYNKEKEIINEKKEKNEKCIKEKILPGQTEPISGVQLGIITEQMKKKFCKIYMANGEYGSGFFCLIPFSDDKLKQLPVLFTNNSVLGENDIKNGETIKFSVENDNATKEIFIDSTRKTYTNKSFDTTIVELKSDEIEENSYLEIDDISFNSSIEKNDYESKEIYIIQLNDKGECSFSTGVAKISENNINNIIYPYSSSKRYLGGAILSLFYFKVVGICKESSNNKYNKGTLIQAPLEEFKNLNKINMNDINNKKYDISDSNKEKSENLKKIKIQEKNNNKINLLGFNKSLTNYQKQTDEIEEKQLSELNEIKIIDEDNKITIVYEIDLSEDSDYLIFSKEFVENNKENCKLFLKNYELDICEYINFAKYGVKESEKLCTIILTKFNIEKFTDMSSMFDSCDSLRKVDFQSFKSENITNMKKMFFRCSYLKEINFNSFKTDKVTDMSFMFFSCYGLRTLDLKSFNTQNVTNMEYMFGGVSLGLNLNSFNTKNVTNMQKMFAGCIGTVKLKLESFNTENVTNMSSMFQNCESLISLNLSSFNTENVTNMSSMFQNCESLISLNLSSFNTDKVESMDEMFCNCYKLKELDFSSFNSSNATSEDIFTNCFDLKTHKTIHFNPIHRRLLDEH